MATHQTLLGRIGLSLPVSMALALSCLSGFSEGDDKGRACRIIFLMPPREAPEEFHFFDGASSHKMPLTGMNLSEVVRLPAGDLVVGITPDPVLKPGDFPPDAPTAKISPGITDFYLIVVNDPDNKAFPFRILPVDSGDKQPKTGQTLWINMTTHAITRNLADGSSITIPPGERVIAKPPLSVSGYYKTEFLYQPNAEGDFLPVMNKSWWFDAKSRNLGFIVDSGGRLPRIFTLRDQRDPDPGDETN